MSAAGRYVGFFAGTLLGVLAFTAAFNFLVDPYDISRVVDMPRLNSAKPREAENARLRKPFDLWRRTYDGVVLGTSQVEQGFDTSNPALAAKGLTLYNAGLSEERPFEQALLLRHAAERTGISFAIISLDFLRYADGGGRPEFLPRTWTPWLAMANYLKTLVSATAVKDSFLTIASNLSGEPSLRHMRDGQLNIEEYFRKVGQPDYHTQFKSIDAIYLNSAYRPMLESKVTLEQRGFDHTAVGDMLATAREHGIPLYFFFSPSHARQFEIIRILGLDALYRRWQAELVCLITEGGSPHAVWDFSGYNTVTTEALPEKGGSMRWYSDPVHYTSKTGRALQNRMLALPSPELNEIEDFGTTLNSKSLAEHFRTVEKRRAYFLDKNPAALDELAGLHRATPEVGNRQDKTPAIPREFPSPSLAPCR